jgi:hypothetical protein
MHVREGIDYSRSCRRLSWYMAHVLQCRVRFFLVFTNGSNIPTRSSAFLMSRLSAAGGKEGDGVVHHTSQWRTYLGQSLAEPTSLPPTRWEGPRPKPRPVTKWTFAPTQQTTCHSNPHPAAVIWAPLLRSADSLTTPLDDNTLQPRLTLGEITVGQSSPPPTGEETSLSSQNIEYTSFALYSCVINTHNNSKHIIYNYSKIFSNIVILYNYSKKINYIINS